MIGLSHIHDAMTLFYGYCLQEANADSVTDKDDQEDDIEDNIEEENDMNHDIPHTDVPDLLYVEEDEFTEKIDVNNHLKENVSEAEIENKVNHEINQQRILQEEKKMKPSETTPIHTSTNVPPPLHLQLPNEFCKPEVEVLNAGHEQSKTVPAALKPKEAFVTQSDKIKTKSNSEQKAKTRVAFADPTMSIQATIITLTLFDIRYFLVHLTWGGARGSPPGKHTSGTFMFSNDLVTHQTHKNG